jgi:hypothetical protein
MDRADDAHAVGGRAVAHMIDMICGEVYLFSLIRERHQI